MPYWELRNATIFNASDAAATVLVRHSVPQRHQVRGAYNARPAAPAPVPGQGASEHLLTASSISMPTHLSTHLCTIHPPGLTHRTTVNQPSCLPSGASPPHTRTASFRRQAGTYFKQPRLADSNPKPHPLYPQTQVPYFNQPRLARLAVDSMNAALEAGDTQTYELKKALVVAPATLPARSRFPQRSDPS